MINKTALLITAAVTLGLTGAASAQGFAVGVPGAGVYVGAAPSYGYAPAPYGYYGGYAPGYAGGVIVESGPTYIEPDYNTGYSSRWDRRRSQRFNDAPGND